jgi:hypothetical protein
MRNSVRRLPIFRPIELSKDHSRQEIERHRMLVLFPIIVSGCYFANFSYRGICFSYSKRIDVVRSLLPTALKANPFDPGSDSNSVRVAIRGAAAARACIISVHKKSISRFSAHT